MGVSRQYATRRNAILDALVRVTKEIDGTGTFHTNLFNNVEPRLLFWDEIEEFPAVNFNTGSESVEYQGAGYKDRYLNVMARCYVDEENAAGALGALLEDLETVIEDNAKLRFIDRTGAEQYTQDITIISIDTDEGTLEPIGVGEIQLLVRY